MKRFFFGAALFGCAAAWGQEIRPGSQVGDFVLADTGGRTVPFASLRGDVTVLLFVSTRCPISNGYNERMNALVKDYNPKGVRFVFVNSNSNESAADVAEHARTHALDFVPYKDPDNLVADRFGATVTPEAFVISREGALTYHGYIDDSLNTARIQNQGLRKALDAVLSGQAVAAGQTKAFGCTIKRNKKVT
jgi:thiol-disulfide isomerase/thioredoxin